MVEFPNAKINLGLSVTERRSDGYHNLETVFYPVPLCDVLEVIRGETFSFRATGLAIDGPMEENLVVKAWRLLEERFGLPPLVIRLHKVIPSGAGLGEVLPMPPLCSRWLTISSHWRSAKPSWRLRPENWEPIVRFSSGTHPLLPPEQAISFPPQRWISLVFIWYW